MNAVEMSKLMLFLLKYVTQIHRSSENAKRWINNLSRIVIMTKTHKSKYHAFKGHSPFLICLFDDSKPHSEDVKTKKWRQIIHGFAVVLQHGHTQTHKRTVTHNIPCTHWPNVCLCKSMKNFMCQRFFASVITWNIAKRMRLRVLYADCELLIVPSFRDLLSKLFIGCFN